MGSGSRVLVVTAAVVVVMAGLQAASDAMVPVVLGVFLAAVSLPVLQRLTNLPLPKGRKLPFGVAVALTVVVDVTIVGIALTILVRSLDSFVRIMPDYLRSLQVVAAQRMEWLAQHGYPVSGEELTRLLSPGAVLGMFRDAAARVTRGFTFSVLVLLILIFSLIEAGSLPAKLQLAFGSESSAADRMRRVVGDVQMYLRVKTFISALVGLSFGLWLSLLGVEAPVLWGFLAFVLNFIPNIGSVIAVIPPTLVAWLQLGPGYAAAALGGNLVINQVLSSGLEPHLMGRSLGLSPLIVIVSLVVWGWIWGAVGVILAVPTTMVIKILMENSDDLYWLAVLLEGKPKAGRAR